jgi:hypothetical protein
MSKTFVGADTVVMNCGEILGPANDDEYYNCGKLELAVGAESGGGRELVVTPEATMIDITRQLQEPLSSTPPPSSLKFNVISRGSTIRNTDTIRNVYLYPSSSIEGACSVENATLYPEAKITNSSVVSNVFMQWNTTISDNSKVNRVLMMEHSHCGPSSIVESTVMGPDTHASAGEIHASIFGPNTNAHHQSLIIGVLWPLGRGNVGYGANVGSNHTGRLPDQETCAGEGTFWGLSCIVKFPVDLTWAPYSIIAAGVKLPPAQRICMPFSLVIENGDKGNEIIPGWVLQSSPYALARNDKKYSTRRKAIHHASYTGWKIFRPAVVEMCRLARESLMLSMESTTSLKDVFGIGANTLTERGRNVGIKAYQDCIHRYVLQGLLTWAVLVRKDDEKGSLKSALDREFIMDQNTDNTPFEEIFSGPSSSVSWPSFPWSTNEADLNEWEYQKIILLNEFPIDDESQINPWLENGLNKLVSLENDFAFRVANCKRRDDTRGCASIPGYAKSHVAADVDPVVTEVLETAGKTEALVKDILAKL